MVPIGRPLPAARCRRTWWSRRCCFNESCGGGASRPSGTHVPEVTVDTSGGGKFNVYEGGKGPLLVLLHSMAASWWSWSRSIPVLEEHFSICAPDLLGHGKSEAKRDVVAVEH